MTDEALKLLTLYSQRVTISLIELGAIYNKDPINFTSPIAYLRKEGYLEILPSHVSLHGDNFTLDAPFRITYKGRTALEAELKSRRHLNFSEFRAWITLAIAIAAFIKSFFF